MMQDTGLGEYLYDLPSGRIAFYPMQPRDSSRLLVNRKGQITEDIFRNLPAFLPEKSVLFFNDTRVIHARLRFRKESGAAIEIFLLEPVGSEINTAMQSRGSTRWKCLAGNARKWKNGSLILNIERPGKAIELSASLIEKKEGIFTVVFNWNDDRLCFAELLGLCGHIPLPPYISREAEPADANSYQTVYAHTEGSVAAPTAGLHFTEQVLHDLGRKNISSVYLTLHVGAGTFKPVTARHIGEHQMHAEEMMIGREQISGIIHACTRPGIAVGTTSLRCLESIYWLGVKSLSDGSLCRELPQWYPYHDNTPANITVEESMEALIGFMNAEKIEAFAAHTSLMIIPGYTFRLTQGLVTNFHQPGSTLLMLVSALAGDSWKDTYKYALEHDFRFLSYGDACLFLP